MHSHERLLVKTAVVLDALTDEEEVIVATVSPNKFCILSRGKIDPNNSTVKLNTGDMPPVVNSCVDIGVANKRANAIHVRFLSEDACTCVYRVCQTARRI